jgi:hypothetical protein
MGRRRYNNYGQRYRMPQQSPLAGLTGNDIRQIIFAVPNDTVTIRNPSTGEWMQVQATIPLKQACYQELDRRNAEQPMFGGLS